MNLVSKYYRVRSKWYRLQRMYFPSPAELRFVEIMGGTILRVGFFKHPKTKFPFAVVIGLGRILENERFKREVRVHRYWLDFANDIHWGIEVDGAMYHLDIVKDFERDEFLTGKCDKKCRYYCRKHSNMGWRIMRIKAVRLWNEPAKVQMEVIAWLNS